MKIHALHLVVLWCVLATTATAAPPEFFAFDNGVGRGSWTPEQQAKTLKELGYDGISYNYTNPADLALWVKTFREHGLKIYGLYVHTYADRPQTVDPAFKEAIRHLKGSDTVIWMTVSTVKDKTRSYDAEAVRNVRMMADLAKEQGLRVALYPHAGFYVATAADSARIIRLGGRDNAGATINLCHEFITGNGGRLDETLRDVAPIATLVSINGIDVAGKKHLLRLDQGDFDLAAYLARLRDAGYKGPVGLQGYSIPGDPRENLKASMTVWRRAAGAVWP
ncbi:MAG: sugar phosphate isomerase/epimerase family protein [Kiritimatiellia bacterium]